MRKVLIFFCLGLLISGVLITYQEEITVFAGSTLLSLTHIWLGLFFIVIFPMYAWDHIRLHQSRIFPISWISSSGIVQLLAGLGLILSGIILLLYSGDKLALPTTSHNVLTFILAVSLSVHFFSNEKK